MKHNVIIIKLILPSSLFMAGKGVSVTSKLWSKLLRRKSTRRCSEVAGMP